MIEGEDRKLFYIWRRAIEAFDGVQLARVVADDWRRMLLSKKEMRDARKAKSAAGLIAKTNVETQRSLAGKEIIGGCGGSIIGGLLCGTSPGLGQVEGTTCTALYEWRCSEVIGVRIAADDSTNRAVCCFTYDFRGVEQNVAVSFGTSNMVT